MKKLVRTSTVALSLDVLLNGQLKFLNRHYEVVAVSGNDDHMKIVEAREGVRTAYIELSRQVSLFKDIISLWHLYWLFKHEKPHMVHSITPKAGLLSMIAARMAGVPVRMHTFTGLIFPSKTGMFRKLLIAMDRLLCKMATNVYPEGNGVKNDLIKFKITDKPLHVLANGNVNGVDTEFFSPDALSADEVSALKNKLGIAPSDFVFIFIGRLVPDKGVNELVTAFSVLAGKRDNAKLLLVGPFENHLTPLDQEVASAIAEHPDIITVGFQRDVRKFLAASDVLVLPSYREGFPNVVIQAGAMGLPSIVTDINGANEIIADGENGIIIPAKDPAALEKAMSDLLGNAPLHTLMRQKARPMVASRFDNQTVWNALLEEYRRLEKIHLKHV